MGRDNEGFLKIRWPLATILWSCLSAFIWFGYNTMTSASRMQTDIVAVSRDVSSLSTGVQRLERRMDLDAQTRYTASEAAKDIALINAQLDNHKRRIDRMEAGKK